MQSEDKKTFNIAADIQRASNIKDGLLLIKGKKPRPGRASTKFLKRYAQDIEIILKNEEFLKAVSDIRSHLGIPSNGFDIKKDKKNIKEWILEKKENNFDEVVEALSKHEKVIWSDPRELLWYMSVQISDDDVYYPETFFILYCPTVEIYENYISEKPFAGVFEYILFGKPFLPQTNFVAVMPKYTDNDTEYILLAISPNTTKRDIVEVWEDISDIQKEMAGYKKNKSRFRKKHSDDLKTLSKDGNYIKMEEIYGDDPLLNIEKKTNASTKKKRRKQEKKYLANIRQKTRRIKKRSKKLVGPK